MRNEAEVKECTLTINNFSLAVMVEGVVVMSVLSDADVMSVLEEFWMEVEKGGGERHLVTDLYD